MIRVRRLTALVLLSLAGAAPVAAQLPAAKPAVTEGDFKYPRLQVRLRRDGAESNLHYRTLWPARARRQGPGHERRPHHARHRRHGCPVPQRQLRGRTLRPRSDARCCTYFIILPDAIGHGKSSKPSDGLRAKFPRYGYGDLVTGQYRLVTEGLKVNHLRLVMGTSMGGMTTRAIP